MPQQTFSDTLVWIIQRIETARSDSRKLKTHVASDARHAFPDPYFAGPSVTGPSKRDVAGSIVMALDDARQTYHPRHRIPYLGPTVGVPKPAEKRLRFFGAVADKIDAGIFTATVYIVDPQRAFL